MYRLRPILIFVLMLLPCAVKVQAREPLAHPLLRKAAIALSSKDTAAARDAASELEQEAIDSNDGPLAMRARAILVHLHTLEGDVQLATEILYAELDRASAEQNWDARRLCLEQLAGMAVFHRCPVEAVQLFEQVRDGSEARGDWGRYAIASFELCRQYRELGRAEDATAAYQAAIAKVEGLDDRILLYKIKLLRVMAAADPSAAAIDELVSGSQGVLGVTPRITAARAYDHQGERDKARTAYEAALSGREDSQSLPVLDAWLDYALLVGDTEQRAEIIARVLNVVSGPQRDLKQLAVRARALFLKASALGTSDGAAEIVLAAEAAKREFEAERFAQQNAFLAAVNNYRDKKGRERDARERDQEEQQAAFLRQRYLWAAIGGILFCLVFVVGFLVRDRYRRRIRNLRVETDRKYRAELQDKLDARSVELESEMDRRLELERAFVQRDRFEAIGALTSGVAHDFNNLMTVVQSVSETVATLAKERLSEREREMMHEVLKAAKSGSEITRQLLQLTRGGNDLFIEPIVISEHVQEIEPLLRRTIGEGIELQIENRDPLATIKVEAAQLTTSLINLCSNSRDAIVAKGVIKIRVETLAVEERAFAQISVCDNGVGMTPDQLVKATKPLYSTKGPEKGSGLGLPIVQRFANRFEGELDISSSPAGTVVRIRIPAVTTSLEEYSRIPNLAGLRVMVVDDKVSVLNSVADTLRQLGCDAHTYHDVTTARIDIESGRINPDLLLADIRLPYLSENQTLADWVEKFAPSISVVLMSGLITPANVAAKHDGQILSKPFTQLELASALERALEGVA